MDSPRQSQKSKKPTKTNIAERDHFYVAMAHARVIHPARRERAEQQAALTRALQATQTTHDEVSAKLAALAADEAAQREAIR